MNKRVINKQIATKDLLLCKICLANIIDRDISHNVFKGYCSFTYDISRYCYILAYKKESLFRGYDYIDAIYGDSFFDEESIISSIQTKSLPIVVESTPFITKKKYLTELEATKYIKNWNENYACIKGPTNTSTNNKVHKLVKPVKSV